MANPYESRGRKAMGLMNVNSMVARLPKKSVDPTSDSRWGFTLTRFIERSGWVIYEYVLVTIFISFIISRSFASLWEVEIKAPILIFSCFIIQVGSMYVYQDAPLSGWFSALILLSYLLLAIGAWLNRKLPGFRLFSIGMILNLLAIASNDGRMPVASKALETANLSHYIEILQSGYRKHQLMDEATILPFLGDVIPLHFPYALMNIVVSVGDLLITLGMCIFFFVTITQNKFFRRKHQYVSS